MDRNHRPDRRWFLQCAALGVPLWLVPWPAGPAARPAPARPITPGQGRAREWAADLVIIGAGLGGCAAALAAARNGLDVILTEATDWIGGQLTQQAVPPDENPWIESFGCTRSYQALRRGIREYYARHYPLTAAALRDPFFNPGNGWVSRIGGEPRVALAVLQGMLAAHEGSGRLRLLLRHRAVAALTHGDRVEAVRVVDLETGAERSLRAPFFVDATELGDLLPLTKTEYRVGADARSDTAEPNAGDTADAGNMQGFTCCFAVDYRAGEDHTIERPREYARWRDHVMRTSREPPYRLLSFDAEASRGIGFDPEARRGFWTYRRIADRDQFTPGFYRGDLSLVNWPQNDYSFGTLCDVSEREARDHVERAKQLSFSLLYWLQTEAPRPDGGLGWKGLRLRPDIVGTRDGMAKHPYIRESRRLRAEFTVLEQHVSTDLRRAETGASREAVRATTFPDSVGIGSYRMDLHITTRGDHGRFGSTLPFQIPLGALIPCRVDNLLPACKNLGVTHLTNGCFRLHPVEWNIGEAAGALAAFCVTGKKTPRQVRNTPGLLADFQERLRRDGVRLAWPKEAGPV